MSSGLCIRPGCVLPREPGSMFCRVDEGAPAGKRGGWLSAYKRRQRAAGGDVIDASNIVRRLWIGAKPPADRPLPTFDTVVLCAEEYQPRMPHVHDVLRVPLQDAMLDPAGLELALLAAREVAQRLSSGKTVLVTCYAGRNRSALVAGLGLGLVTRMTADQIIQLVRARRRPDCFTNAHFRAYMKAFIGAGRVPRRR